MPNANPNKTNRSNEPAIPFHDPRFNVGLSRYDTLIEKLLDASRHSFDTPPPDLLAEVASAVIDLVEIRQAGTIVALLHLVGDFKSELRHAVTNPLNELGDRAIKSICEEVTGRPEHVSTPGAMLLLALMESPEALVALDDLWSDRSLPYPVRARAFRLLSASRAGFFDDQWTLSEEFRPDARAIHELVELLGDTLFSSLSAFHIDWLAGAQNLDFSLALLSLSSFVWRRNEFCMLVRTNGYEDRCQACDQCGMKRAVSTGKPAAYNCHVGLTDIVVPIVLGEDVVGSVITGQFLIKKPNEDGFDQVCKSLGALPPELERSLKKAYFKTPYVGEDDLPQITRGLEVVAKLLLNLWTKTQRSHQKTRELHSVKYFGRRELIETVLFGQITLEEFEARLCDLERQSTPNTVIQLRFEDLSKTDDQGRPPATVLPFERGVLYVAEELEKRLDALVAPMRFGEMSALVPAPITRNPNLSRVQLKEAVRETIKGLQQETGLRAFAGIGPTGEGIEGLRTSFERASEALLRAITDASQSIVDTGETIDSVVADIDALESLEAKAAVALCEPDADIAVRELDEVLATLHVHAKLASGRYNTILSGIITRASEIAIQQGIARDEIFAIRFEFLEQTQSLSDLNETRSLLCDFREALSLELESVRKESVDRQVIAAKKIIESRYADTVTREDLADQVGMSEWHLTTSFRRIVGMPPRDYLHKVRIEEAKQQLLSSQESVSDIAYSVGYGTTANFRRMFQKWVGCSPTEFRRHTHQFRR